MKITKAQHGKLVNLADGHQKADEYKSGHYEWRDGGACSIGCTLRDGVRIGVMPSETAIDSHAAWGEASGMGHPMARLQDAIFEGLARTDMAAARAFTPKVLRAIRLEADYALAWPKLAAWLLRERVRKCTTNPKSLAAIDGVLVLYDEWLKTGTKPIAAAAAAEAAAAAARKSFWAAIAEKFIAILREGGK